MSINEPRIRSQISHAVEKLRWELAFCKSDQRKEEILNELRDIEEKEQIMADLINSSTD